MLDRYPELRGMYDENDHNTEVLYFKNPTATIYSFTEEPQLDVDFIAPTFYCEKHPDSPFFPDEMFSLKTAEGRITLDGNVFKEFRNGNVEVRKLSESELSGAYRKFGLA